MARKFHPGSLRGPATPSEKAIRGYFESIGMPEGRIPPQLRDKVVAKSKKGPIGSIVLRKMTGLEHNDAQEITAKFEKNVGGKEEVAEKLEFVADLTPEQKNLVAMIKSGSKKSLARLIAESGAEPTSIMRQYARGCMEMGVVEAAIEAHRALPRVVKDLVGHALDAAKVCKTCVGLGRVKSNSNYEKEDAICVACEGSGYHFTTSKHKEFAVQKLLEVTKQVGNGKEGVTVNVQQNVATFAGGRDFLASTLLANEEILNPSRRGQEVVDAEVVGRASAEGNNQGGTERAVSEVVS